MYFLRRLHLYLGLVLLPWVLMYGLSALPFAHHDFFEARDKALGKPLWTPRYERPLEVEVPADREGMREFGRMLLKDLGISAPNFGVYRPNRNAVQVTAFSFLKTTRALYRIDRKTVTVEDRRFRLDHFLTGMHARGGFEQPGLMPKLWGVVVDVVSVMFVAWVVTGVIMWWRVREARVWGICALVVGVGAFTVFTVAL